MTDNEAQQPDQAEDHQPTDDDRTVDKEPTDWKSEARKWEQRAKANATAS